jgi:hypothetical protein
MDDDRDVLDVFSQLLEVDRQFYGVVRFLDGAHRTHVVAAHQRNTNLGMTLLREYMRSNPSPNLTITVPIPAGAFDVSGNFFDPVPVVPTPDQIRASTDLHVSVHDQTCAICQDPVECATRIRHCGHCFHSQCIGQWFSMNPRCPVCRYDIRSLQPSPRRETNVPQSNRMYADEE